MRVIRPVLVVLALLAVALPAYGLFKPKSVSGNLDADPALEQVKAVRVPDPLDPSNNLLARTAVDVVDKCRGGPIEQRIAGPQEVLVTLRLVSAETRRGREVLVDLRSGASGRFGEIRLVALRRAPAGSPVCTVPHDDFRYLSSHPTRHPRGAPTLTDFELTVRDFQRRFRGRELRLTEGWARPSDALCCPTFKKITFYRYDRGRDRYVPYASKVTRNRTA